MSSDLAGLAKTGSVLAVHRSGGHTFSKTSVTEVELAAGLGVVGDAHNGATVRHRSRVRVDPTQPNLRQVHLIHAELFDLVAHKGIVVEPGQMGENLTSTGVDLLRLPVGSMLKVGATALLAVTGLRNPCGQLNGLADGLLDAVTDRADDGSLIRLAGVMAVVVLGGVVRPGDEIRVALPPEPHHPLEKV